MNRYTALYHTHQAASTPAQLRLALEQALAGALTPGTYRLGQVAPQGENQIAVEIATRQPKDAIQHLLAGIAQDTGCTLAHIGWGWTISGNLTFELIDEATGALLHDPLVDETPQAEPEGVYTYGWAQTAGLALVLLGAVVVILLAVGYLLIPEIAAWFRENLVMIVLGALLYWIILRGLGAIVTPWSYIRSIAVDQAGITINNLLTGPNAHTWQQISELQIVDNRCMLLADDRPLYFPILEKLGMRDRLVLVKTVIARSDLLFVGGKVGELTYRRFEA